MREEDREYTDLDDQLLRVLPHPQSTASVSPFLYRRQRSGIEIVTDTTKYSYTYL